jgi:hypothetical protein
MQPQSVGRLLKEHLRNSLDRGRFPGVFTLLSAQREIISLSNPLMALRSSSESYSSGAAACALHLWFPNRLSSPGRLPPLRLHPLRRFPTGGQPPNPEVTSLRVPLPSQRFSRSQGFPPPTSCRPYSMPVPSMGFHPSGFSPTRGAVRALKRPCPPAVSVRAAKLLRSV